MSEEQQQQSTETQGSEGEGTSTASTSKTLTQDEVNGIVKRREEAAEQRVLQQLQEKTGMSPAQLEELAKAAKEREDAQKTELDKLKEANETLSKDSEAKVTAAQQELHTERVKAQLLKAKVALPEDDDKAEAALNRLVPFVSSQPGATVEDIRTAISEAKEQFPALFVASETAPSGTPSGKPSGTPTRKPALGETAEDKAKRLAQESNKARGVTAPTA